MPQIDELPLVLVVDDDEVFRKRLCRAFSERDWAADAVSNGSDALIFAIDRRHAMRACPLRFRR